MLRIKIQNSRLLRKTSSNNQNCFRTNHILERVFLTSSYLECDVSFNCDTDIEERVMKISSNMWKKFFNISQVVKDTKIKLFNVMAVPRLLYGSVSGYYNILY